MCQYSPSLEIRSSPGLLLCFYQWLTHRDGPKRALRVHAASCWAQNLGRDAVGIGREIGGITGRIPWVGACGKRQGVHGATTRAASARSQLRGPQSRKRYGGVGEGIGGVNGGRSTQVKAGVAGSQNAQTAGSALQVHGASCGAQNRGRDMVGLSERIGGVNGQIPAAEARGERRERVGSQNARCEHAKPAAGPKIEEEMRCGCEKKLVVRMGESRRWEHAGKGGSGWGAKMHAASAQSQREAGARGKRRGWVGNQNTHCERAEPATGSKIQVDMRLEWIKELAVRMGEFRRRERAGGGTDLRGVSSGFEMRRTFSTCLGNGRGPRGRGGPGRVRWRKERRPPAFGNAAAVMGSALVEVFPAWAARPVAIDAAFDHPPSNWDEKALAELEDTVTAYYAQSFVGILPSRHVVHSCTYVAVGTPAR
ncbi:hypothetical protein B0H19DRAFT_1074245 [Mycena capillaripes]|nr:hypothetical protein B0H19DRAFT_1074245 [Mycena capillaripes]